MNKELVPSVVAIFLASVHLAAAQQQANVRRVGFLGNASAAAINVFRQGLRDTGWVDGQNITIQYRSHQEKNARLPGLAAELVQLNVNVIVATSTEPALAARQVTRTIPIVMVGLADPVEAGLVISLARPGGNVTGLSNVNTELGGKRLELLKEAFPKVSSVAVLWRSAGTANQQQMKAIEIAARSLQVKLQPVAVEGRPSDFESAFSSMKTERASALITLASSVFGIHLALIVDLADKNRLPAIYPSSTFAEAGGLMSYGPNRPDLFRRAATYVDKILKGTKPADLPVEQPTKFEFIVNLKAAKQIGVTIPPNVLVRADRVIK